MDEMSRISFGSSEGRRRMEGKRKETKEGFVLVLVLVCQIWHTRKKKPVFLEEIFGVLLRLLNDFADVSLDFYFNFWAVSDMIGHDWTLDF